METYQDAPLLGEPTLPPREGLHKPLIYSLLIGGGGAVFALLVWAVQVWLNPAPPPPPPVVSTTAPALQTPPLPLDSLMREAYPTSFANQDRRPPIPVAEVIPPPPTEPPVTKAEPAPAAPAPKPPETKAAPASTTAAGTAATTTTRPRTKNWLFAKTAQHMDKAATSVEKDKEKSQALITAATWVRPVDPTRVLYRGAVIHGIVLEQVVSDIKGDIRIHIDRPVLDSIGMGRTLIPQNAEAIVRQVAQVRYGDKRLETELVQIRCADGTLIQFKGAGADKSGAAGFTGKVDNKYPQLLLGIVGTTALSIGAQAAGGNSNSYQPTIQQQIGRDVAGGVNQAGQDVLKRELQVNPTITVAAKDQVTIEVQENISLLTDPIVVNK